MTNHISANRHENLWERADAATKLVPFGTSRDERLAYQAHQGEVRAEFATRLHKEYAPDLSDAVHAEVFRRAWDEGHSAGFYEVTWRYEELAEFAEFVQKNS